MKKLCFGVIAGFIFLSASAFAQSEMIEITFLNSDDDHFAKCSMDVSSLEDIPYATLSLPTEDLIRKAAKGDTRAARILGVNYHSGVGVEPDIEEAIQFYKVAASKGDILSTTALGEILFEKSQESNDTTVLQKALRYLSEGARCGDRQSQYRLGRHLLEQTSKKQKASGLYWLKRAATQKSDHALMFLGHAYYEGKLIKKDILSAAYYYKQVSVYAAFDPEFASKLQGLDKELNSEEFFKLNQLPHK